MSKASKLHESSKTKRVGTQKLDSHKTFSDKLMSKLSSENPDVADIHQLIQEFMTATDKYERILYSHITNNFYELDKLKIDTVIANVGELLAYSESFDGGDVDCKKVIIKLYDHIMLANHQRGLNENSSIYLEDKFKLEITKFKEETTRDHITILGIFSSVVLTFVAGLVFTSSLLQGMSTVSTTRLILVSCFIAFIFSNTIALLLSFIEKINNISSEDSWAYKIIKKLNMVIIVLVVLTVIIKTLSFYCSIPLPTL